MEMSPAVSSAPRSRRTRVVIAVLAAALLAAVAYGLWQHYGQRQTPADLYQLVAVQRTDIEDVVTATGTLQPLDYVDVGAQVSGQLERFHIEVGSEVKSGDLLAEIDPTVLQSKVDATRAQLRNQRAQLMDREASLALAEIQHRRQLNLIAEQATTEEAVQQAEASLRSARAQIEALRAQIEQTESNLRADEANLNYTRIFAPIDGTVVSITARQGQTLNANQQAPTILRIANLSTMTVQTQVSEADVSRLRVGMEAYFTTLGNPGQRWYGRLRKIEPTPTVTNNVVLYNALFDVPNRDGRLMSQMTAQVFFIVARAQQALTVPMAALNNLAPQGGAAERMRQRPQGAEGMAQRRPDGERRPPGERRNGDGPARSAGPGNEEGGGTAAAPGRRATVRVLAADGSVVEREVRIGVTSRIAAEVLEGLEEGAQVVAGLRQGGAQGSNSQGSAAGGQPPAGVPWMPR